MQLNPILQRIDSLKKEAENLKAVKAESEKVFWDKYRLEFNYNSNHLEGNTLTYGHTQLLLLFDRVVADYTGREIEEMKAHDLALKIVKEAALNKEDNLTEKFIKEINEIILVRPFYKNAITPDGLETRRLIEPGQYKKYANSVRLENGEIFNYASPEETPALMGDLLTWYREEEQKQELHSVQLAALFHYRFVRIHPFDDSNGRTSRLMMNYILIKNGYAPLVIESDDKKNYLTALNKADIGDLQAFTDYITNLSLRWQELYVRALRGEKIEEDEDFDKEVELLKKKITEKVNIKSPISQTSVEEAFTRSIYPLLKKIEEKISKFDDLFLDKFISMSMGSKNFKEKNIGQLEIQLKPLLNNLSFGGYLNIEFIHKGFKISGNTPFNYFSYITIETTYLTYKIKIGKIDNGEIEKFYHQYFTHEEIDFISDKIAKLELEEIKKYTKN